MPGAVLETSAHLTGAGSLPTKYIIHSVAVGFDEEERRLCCNGDIIAKSTKNVLKLAEEQKLKSVGFPAFGTGLYSVPLEEAVEAIGNEFSTHLWNKSGIERLGLVLYNSEQYETGKRVFDKILRLN